MSSDNVVVIKEKANFRRQMARFGNSFLVNFVYLIVLPLLLATLILAPIAISLKMLFKQENWFKATQTVRIFFLALAFPFLRILRGNTQAKINANAQNISFSNLTRSSFPTRDLEQVVLDNGDADVTELAIENSSITSSSQLLVKARMDVLNRPVILEGVCVKNMSEQGNDPANIVLFFGGNKQISLGPQGQSMAFYLAQILGPNHAVYDYNRRNTGNSLGVLTQPKDLIDDAEAFFDAVQSRHPESQISCVGLSMGGWEATELVARKHAKAKAQDTEQALLPKLLNVHSFSKLSNIVADMPVRLGPGLGHLVGLILVGITKMLGLEMNSEKAWNIIPSTHKKYQVLQAPKGIKDRYDTIIGNSAALHNASTVKSARRKLKKQLRKTIKMFESDPLHQHDIERAKAELNEIKDCKATYILRDENSMKQSTTGFTQVDHCCPLGDPRLMGLSFVGRGSWTPRVDAFKGFISQAPVAESDAQPAPSPALR